MSSDLEATRARALIVFEGAQKMRMLANKRALARQIAPHFPALSDGMEAALAHAASVQRDVNGGWHYWSEADAIIDLRLATFRLECQMRLIVAAIGLTERAITLRERQIQAAVQRVTAPLMFGDAVSERMHTVRLNRLRRETERAEAEAARAEAQALLADLLKALRTSEATATPQPATEQSVEDRLATGSATPEELERYRRRT